jgi:hypothetical protein
MTAILPNMVLSVMTIIALPLSLFYIVCFVGSNATQILQQSAPLTPGKPTRTESAQRNAGKTSAAKKSPVNTARGNTKPVASNIGLGAAAALQVVRDIGLGGPPPGTLPPNNVLIHMLSVNNDGVTRAYVGQTRFPKQRASVSRLRHDPPPRLLKFLQKNNLSIEIVQMHALEIVPLCRAASAECHWTRLASAEYPDGFNDFGTYGPPSRTRNPSVRALTDKA